MLVLSRKVGEKVVIGQTVTLVVKRITGQRVILGVEAPLEMSIVRSELKRLPGGDRASDLLTREAVSGDSLRLSTPAPIGETPPKAGEPQFVPMN